MNRGFPWDIVVWAFIGAVALRPVFTDDVEYLGACLVYAVILGLVKAVLDIKDQP
jgi:uncharacterized membrane protein YcaP (DUF421 family)